MKLSKEFSRKNSKLTNDIEKGGVLQLTCSETGFPEQDASNGSMRPVSLEALGEEASSNYLLSELYETLNSFSSPQESCSYIQLLSCPLSPSAQAFTVFSSLPLLLPFTDSAFHPKYPPLHLDNLYIHSSELLKYSSPNP